MREFLIAYWGHLYFFLKVIAIASIGTPMAAGLLVPLLLADILKSNIWILLYIPLVMIYIALYTLCLDGGLLFK